MATYTHEWLCQQIVENSQEAIIFADRDGIIRLWNTGAETIFGYRAAEVVGQSLELIIPERLRAQHRHGYHRVMATGVTLYDRKLLAVPAHRLTAMYDAVDDIGDIQPIQLERVKHFFAHYKDLEPNKWSKIHHLGDAAEARRVIVDSIERGKAGKG